MHPLRFGVMVTTPPTSGVEWAERARRYEAMGFSVLSLPNHLAGQPAAPWPALMAAAAATTTLRVGTLVVDNELLHPAVVASDAATVDLLSDGRLEFGIGAGWLAADHELIGQPFLPAGERIERLTEAIVVIRRLWTESQPVTHSGAAYSLSGLHGRPRPAQVPHPPILIGGGGRRVLQLAAREADIVGLVPNMASGAVGAASAATATGTATREKLAWIREAAGDRFGSLELQVNVTSARVTDDRDAALAKVANAYGVSDVDAADVPHALVGSVDEICATVLRRREALGISYLTIFEASAVAIAPVIERLAGR